MPHPLQSPAPRRAGDANKIEYILTARLTGIKNLKKCLQVPPSWGRDLGRGPNTIRKKLDPDN
jgi:hypothetical protein